MILTQTIGISELSEITGLRKDTLSYYLNSYRFAKFRTTPMIGLKSRYALNSAFLNTLYTYLDLRHKYKQGRQLKEHFKEFNVDFVPWEDFICES